MATVVVKEVTPPTILAWQITTQTAPDLVTALTVAAMTGWTGNAICTPTGGGSSSWELVLTKEGYPTCTVYVNDWIVIDGKDLDTYHNDEFIAKFTSNVPLVWAGASAPPTATAMPGRQAAITVPLPTSYNSPFTWTVEQTTEGASSAATLAAGPPVVSNGQVHFLVVGLNDADYTFTVTCNTQYLGVSATSPASNPITASLGNVVAAFSGSGQLATNVRGYS